MMSYSNCTFRGPTEALHTCHPGLFSRKCLKTHAKFQRFSLCCLLKLFYVIFQIDALIRCLQCEVYLRHMLPQGAVSDSLHTRT